VNYLLKAVEDNRDKIVVIVAGYADQARGCSSDARGLYPMIIRQLR
jgi:hypothetical protein